MSTPIEDTLKSGMITYMAAEMSKANSYRYDVGSINEFELAASLFPRHIVTWGKPVTQDRTDGTTTDRFRQRYMEIRSQWKNTDEIAAMDAVLESEKMREDIKRLVGGLTTLGSTSEIYFVRTSKMFSNDNTYPIAIKTELLVKYWQIRTQPETAG